MSTMVFDGSANGEVTAMKAIGDMDSEVVAMKAIGDMAQDSS
jgi:hypothetical protein